MRTLTQRILVGISATYPTNKPWERWQSHLCLNQMLSQQQALSLKLLICVSVECRRVEELISFDFFTHKLLLELGPNLEILNLCAVDFDLLQRRGYM